ncbi:hypothetical protein ACQ4PT_046910 [Festuca glaucescens]
MAAIAWTDENTSIVTELFAAEVGRGNCSSTHLNNVGYEEVARRFKDKTGIELKKTQLKNKWDKLKADYNIWKRLLKQTGAGWDHIKGTFEQDKEWWKKAKNVSVFFVMCMPLKLSIHYFNNSLIFKHDIPGCGRFQKQGIRNEEHLKVMFEDINNDGSDHWCPTSGDLPQPTAEVDVVHLDGEDTVDIDEIDESPSCSKGKRSTKVVGDKSKKLKTSQVMQDEIRKLGVLAERTQSSLESYTKKDDTCTVNTVMDLVVECGEVIGSDEHFIATELFVKKEQREMFLHMQGLEDRLNWLKRKYVSKYGRSEPI